MDRYLLISADCHAGPLPEQAREYGSPAYREAFAGVPRAECEQMLGATTAEVYGFDVETLSKLAAEIGADSRSIGA